MQSESQVLVHAQVAVFSAWVLPRDAEDRMALVDQMPDEGILRRQVEDVVLHDPGRHDQDRFGMNFFCRGRVLDEFDQIVPENDLPGRRGKIAPDLETFGTRRRPARPLAEKVIQEVLETPREICAILCLGLPQHDEIERGHIGRRKHLQPLPGAELHQAPMLRIHAPDPSCSLFPPLALQLVAAAPQVVGPGIPRGIVEAPVTRWRQHGQFPAFGHRLDPITEEVQALL